MSDAYQHLQNTSTDLLSNVHETGEPMKNFIRDRDIRWITSTMPEETSYIPQVNPAGVLPTMSFADFLVQHTSSPDPIDADQTTISADALRQALAAVAAQQIDIDTLRTTINLPELTPLEELVAEINSCTMLAVTIPMLNWSYVILTVHAEILAPIRFRIQGNIIDTLTGAQHHVTILMHTTPNNPTTKLTELRAKNTTNFFAYFVEVKSLQFSSTNVNAIIELL